MPEKHFFSEPFEMVRCDGKAMQPDTSEDQIDNKIDLSFLKHSEIVPYLIAGNLRPGSLNACVNASWIVQSAKPLFGERFDVTFQLIISVDVNFEKSKICVYSFQSDTTFKQVMLKRELDTFKPNKSRDPYLSIHKPKERLAGFRVTKKLTSNSLQTKKIISHVQEMLSGLQRKFYGEVAEKFEQDQEGIAIAGSLLSGSKHLWRSFVIMGFPLSMENNDNLRALLFGSDAILAGSGGEKQDSFLDNLQNIYSYFSVREELPPDANIIGDIETVVTKRVENLIAIIKAIIEGRQAVQDAEVFELFAPIILRLKLINSRTA